MKNRPQTGKLDAFKLFPDLMKKIDTQVQSRESSETARTVAEDTGKRQPKTPKSSTIPPPPPDVSWLRNGIYEDQEQVKDIPPALVLMTDRGAIDFVSITLQELGYQVEFSQTPYDAIHKLTSINYAVVVMHARFEKEISLAESMVHNYMSRLPMERRRLMYYILVGAEFRTLYNLEALSLSANLVVNDADVEQLAMIFRKSFHDYRKLIEPLLESLDNYRPL